MDESMDVIFSTMNGWLSLYNGWMNEHLSTWMNDISLSCVTHIYCTWMNVDEIGHPWPYIISLSICYSVNWLYLWPPLSPISPYFEPQTLLFIKWRHLIWIKTKTEYHCIKCTGFEIIMASISIAAVKAPKKKEKKPMVKLGLHWILWESKFHSTFKWNGIVFFLMSPLMTKLKILMLCFFQFT
jgi:hypothetical protein